MGTTTTSLKGRGEVCGYLWAASWWTSCLVTGARGRWHVVSSAQVAQAEVAAIGAESGGLCSPCSSAACRSCDCAITFSVVQLRTKARITSPLVEVVLHEAAVALHSTRLAGGGCLVEDASRAEYSGERGY
jgi:hypothetical protein